MDMAGKVTVRGVILGEGLPKICVPIMGTEAQALCLQAREALQAGAQLVEWRADFFGALNDPCAVGETLSLLREAVGDTPLLFTVRTAREGGRFAGSPEEYLAAVEQAAARGADLVDVELFSGAPVCKRAADAVRQQGAKLVLSSHDFQATPDKSEMLARLWEMRAQGADIAKLAVMPNSPADVLALLEVTERANAELDCPVITMSMGALGAVSRVSGAFFGSAVTFGAAGQASAPGQLAVGALRRVLDALGAPEIDYTQGAGK